MNNQAKSEQVLAIAAYAHRSERRLKRTSEAFWKAIDLIHLDKTTKALYNVHMIDLLRNAECALHLDRINEAQRHLESGRQFCHRRRRSNSKTAIEEALKELKSTIDHFNSRK